MDHKKFKKTFVLRVALSVVLSLAASFTSLCCTTYSFDRLENRLTLLETSQPVYSPTAEETLRAVHDSEMFDDREVEPTEDARF